MPILWPLKVPERGNAITQRKTLEIEPSCLFIHHTIRIHPFSHLILFNTPKKSLLKSSYPSQIFVPKKIPESKISNPNKSFDHPRHLKSRVPPLGLYITTINILTINRSAKWRKAESKPKAIYGIYKPYTLSHVNFKRSLNRRNVL